MNQEKIAKFILTLRKKNNLTQAAFAKKLNVTYQAVSKWENAKGIPDIEMLHLISKTFNVDIDEIINGEAKKKSKQKIIAVLIFLLLIIFVAIILLFHFSNNNFTFKTISTSCKEFEISGSAAYNKAKTYIYISNINYCGKNSTKVYTSVMYNLYNDDKVIAHKKVSDKGTLEAYLKDLKIKVNDYKKSCPILKNSGLYLEIKAYDEKMHETIYKIPLTLKENC